MSADGFPSSALAVAGILLLAVVLGRCLVSLLVPMGNAWRAERWGWSVALGIFLLAVNVCSSLIVGIRPGWLLFLLLGGAGAALSRRLRAPSTERPAGSGDGWSVLSWILLALTAAGVLRYLVRCLSEPMWSNDFVAIWGLKGKWIFATSGLPRILFRSPEFDFANRDYPLGLPLVFAGVAFLQRRWDDQALALLYPGFQIGTLIILVGWLRRRGVGTAASLATSALIAHFGFLYSFWLIGVAEVPASFAFVLVGTALADVLDETDSGAVRRLAFGSLFAAATKNEGILLAVVASAILGIRAVIARAPRMGRAAAIVLFAVCGSVLLHRIAVGHHATRGVDLRMLRQPGLAGRLAETAREELRRLGRPAWAGFVAATVLVALGRRRTGENAILFLAASSLAVYLALPVVSPFGPGWLVHWTIGRIASALVPLAAAGIAVGWRNGADAVRTPLSEGRPFAL